MNPVVFIQSEDLDCGYMYSIHISIKSAYRIINARIGESVPLDGENSFAYVKNKTISIHSGNKGGISDMSKDDVLEQINAQLHNM